MVPKPQRRTRMMRIARIFTDTSYPRVSAQSAFYYICFPLKNTAPGTKVSAFIRVYLRFINTVIFQTGLTGYVFYLASSEILRKLAEKSMSGASGRQRADIASIKILEIQALSLPIQRKNANLRCTRDMLLPKLISGEFDIEGTYG
jgi:hypothetical protein